MGAAGTGWQAGTGIANIQNGKPYTGTLDLIGAVLGVKGLVDGHKGYLNAVAKENAAAQSKIDTLNRVGKQLDNLAAETRSVIDGIDDLTNSSYVTGQVSKEGRDLIYNRSNPNIDIYNPLAKIDTPEVIDLVLQGKLTSRSLANNVEDIITMNQIRRQVAQDLGKNSKKDGIRTGDTRNISKANVSITKKGSDITTTSRIQGFSGTENARGYIGHKRGESQRRLQTTEILGTDRSQDPEAKMLEYLLTRTKESDTIHIILRTERPVCSSCLNTIPQFRRLRPHTTVEIRGSVIKG